jgi:uncharacterized protein (DUF2236 family)
MTDAVPLGPDSLTWQLGFPRTGLLLAGRALVLQTAHPVVGAGVRDFSDFTDDPWGRLSRTLRSLQVQLFGGPAAAEEAARLRVLHAGIRGTGFSGERYCALDPDAYAWVHLSNFDTILAGQRWIGPSLSDEETARLYTEWRQVGLVLGVRDDRMPCDLEQFCPYVRAMVEDTLEDNETVRSVLRSLTLKRVGPPPWGHLPAPLWGMAATFGGNFLRDVTVGTLPRTLRDRLGLRRTALDRQRLAAAGLLIRAAAAPLPDCVVHYPRGARARHEARGYLAARAA